MAPVQRVATSGCLANTIHFHAGGVLSLSEPAVSPDIAFDEYISDPARPVPYIDKIAIGMTRPYMTDDQVRCIWHDCDHFHLCIILTRKFCTPFFDLSTV